MVNVVQFKPKDNSPETNRKYGRKSCNSPIVIDRICKTIVAIEFHKACFDIHFLEYALRDVVHGEIWDICKTNDHDLPYASYRVVLKYKYRNEADEILAGAVEKIVKYAYLEEVRVWANEIEMNDLLEQHHYANDYKVSIQSNTKNKLTSVGITTVRELTNHSREEICSIPKMTTEEVAKIEKSLASRGLSLLTILPPFSL